MSNARRVLAVALLVCAVGAVLAVKHRTSAGEAAPSEAAIPVQEDPKSEALPRLVDLGAGKCIPCKMMAPILEELKEEYADTFSVEFIDVWENPDAGEPYDVRIIPTQVFYDAAGKELFRHEGFFGKDEILAKWKEHGVVPSAAPGV